jgi:ribosomal protein L37E
MSKPTKETEALKHDDPRLKPNWEKECENCGAKPVVPLTGMCGPCTFGEAETARGNW